ncbi:T9SS type A sorting domain-containing protein [bacterium]|nr:T9SS type A sorting domain-containing protein [bacterium]
MRIVYICIWSLLLSTQLMAQLVLESKDLPKVGQFYAIDSNTVFNGGTTHFDEFDKISTAGPIAVDMKWLTGTRMDTIQFFDPQNTDLKSSFPDANLLMKKEFDFVFEKSDSGLYIQGMSLKGQVAKFDTALKYLPTPLTLGDSFNSVGSSQINFGTLVVNFNFVRKCKVVNFGSVTMPNDSSFEILYFDVYNYLEFVVLNGSDTMSSFADEEYVYELYSPEFGFPLVRGRKNIDKNKVQHAEFINLDITSAIKPQEMAAAEITMYPNPSRGLVTISANEAVKSVRIFDLSGKELLYEQVNNSQVVLNHLEAGVYVVAISAKNGQNIMRKLVVE